MKISSIETIAINVPLKKGLTAKTAHGEHAVSPYGLGVGFTGSTARHAGCRA